MAVKVLIVDDQTAFRSVAREVVAATAGFEVVGEASSGEESVAAATRLHPDLVLMDVRLPGVVDGLEASRLIRSEHDEITVFLLSTYDEEEFASRISGSRAAAFIPKFAFSPDSLVSAWDAVIDRTDSSQTRVQKDHT